MRAWASMEYTRLVQTTSPPRYYLFDASSVEMSGDVDREERYGREREREAGDSLLYLGMGWGAHKRLGLRKKSLRLETVPGSSERPGRFLSLREDRSEALWVMD